MLQLILQLLLTKAGTHCQHRNSLRVPLNITC